MIPENPAMVVVGLLLMLAARFVKHRTVPFGGKAIRPVTDTERLLPFSFGLLAFVRSGSDNAQMSGLTGATSVIAMLQQLPTSSLPDKQSSSS